jgi:hypothetical protein
MLGIDRWLSWRPADEKFDASPKDELPKPTEPHSEVIEGTSVSSVSSSFRQTQNFPGSMAHHDPEDWAAEFAVWMKERCAHREGKDDWGGVGALLVDFGEWAKTHKSVPCTRPVLEALLRDAGFHVVNGLVRGLVLLADLRTTFPDAIAGQAAVRSDLEHSDMPCNRSVEWMSP